MEGEKDREKERQTGRQIERERERERERPISYSYIYIYIYISFIPYFQFIEIVMFNKNIHDITYQLNRKDRRAEKKSKQVQPMRCVAQWKSDEEIE